MSRPPAPAVPGIERRPAIGVAAMMATTLIVPLMGMSAKILHELGLDAITMMALRSVGVLLLLVPLLVLASQRRALVRADKRAHFWHAVFGLSSMACFYYGLGHMQLVVVTAINFTTPMFMMLLAIPLLGERPDWPAWGAVGIGFAGTLLVIDPSLDAVDWPALVVLLGSFLTACMAIAIRRMPANSTHFAVLFYYAFLGAGVFGLAGLVTADEATRTGLGQPLAWTYIGVLALLALLIQFSLTLAYRLASSSSVAALDYFRLIWAGLIGWLVFTELPGPAALAGMVLIIASGLYLIAKQARPAR